MSEEPKAKVDDEPKKLTQHEVYRMQVASRLSMIADYLKDLSSQGGKEVRRKRWFLRREKRMLDTGEFRQRKGTAKGAQTGAYGNRKPYDTSKPLTPAEMREKYADVVPVLAARRKKRRKAAKLAAKRRAS